MKTHTKNNLLKSVFTIAVTAMTALLLLMLFIPNGQQIASAAASESASAEALSAVELRKLAVIDDHVAGMSSDYDIPVTRSATKTLYDFAGNTYTLVECTPSGYMVMCDDSATMVEYSAKSPSPYAGYSSNLYYGGPTFFYALDNNVLVHTVTEETLDYNPTQRIANAENSLYNSSNTMHSDLVAYKDEISLQFIQEGVSPKTESVYLYGHYWTAVNNSAFFRNKTTQTQMGYLSGGYCGFIAANLLLGYYDTFGSTCIPSGNYMTGSGVNRHFTGSSLTQLLVNTASNNGWNPANGSTSTKIRKTMNKYFKDYGYNKKYGSYDMITPFFSGTTLKNLVDDNTPSILFGSINKPSSPSNTNPGDDKGNHAVVVYGYKSGGTGGALYSLLVHYGWSNYSESTVNYVNYSVFGSMYRVNVK